MTDSEFSTRLQEAVFPPERIAASWLCKWEEGDNHDLIEGTQSLAELIRTLLAESRAAMREECALRAESFRMTAKQFKSDNRIRALSATKLIAEDIRSLPADASALDARDARVRLEEANEMQKVFIELGVDDEDIVNWLSSRIAQLQRSAEKGKRQ
jgi:hypothetical protein